MKRFKFKTGDEIPALGLGTWQMAGGECERAVTEALEIGYRHIDTAEIYGNQQEIGRALKRSSVKRDDIFVTSKVPSSNLKKEDAVDSVKRTLEALKLDYLDLILVHWPSRSVPTKEPLEAFELLKEKGLIKNYGVSNYAVELLKKIPSDFEVVNNQVEYHPSLNQEDLRAFCDEENIVLTAYSPLGKGEDLNLDVLKEVGKDYGMSPAQTIINWLIAKGIVAIPKAADKKHLKENFKSLDWEMKDKDIKKIDALDRKNRLVNPSFWGFD